MATEYWRNNCHYFCQDGDPYPDPSPLECGEIGIATLVCPVFQLVKPLFFNRGHYITNPNNALLKGKSPKFTIHL